MRWARWKRLTGGIGLEKQAFIVDQDVVRADPNYRTVLLQEGVGFGCRQADEGTWKSV